MSTIVSRWPVRTEYRVTADDVDGGGSVLDTTVARWVDAARVAYLDRCGTLRGVELRTQTAGLPPGVRLGRPTTVAVSAGVSEVAPSAITIRVRLRVDDDTVLNTAVRVWPVDASGNPQPVGDEIRDELISIEHAAEHFN